MLSILFTIIKLLIILCVVATIHEFGHFLMSKLFKIGVNEFSIGFGPKIVQKKYKGTMYSLRWLPLGGYCAIEGEDGESKSEHSFANAKTWKKVLILCMGVIFNAILAVVIFVSIAFSFPTYNTKITEMMPNSIAQEAGLQVGDQIVSIEGHQTNLRSDLLDQRIEEGKTDVTVEYIRNGEKHQAVVKNAVTEIGYIGISFKVLDDNSDVSNEIEMVASGGAAVKAGLKAGDKVVSVNGISTQNSSDVISIVQKNAHQQVEVTIERKGETITKTVTPESKQQFSLQIATTEQVKTTLSLAFVSAASNVKTIVGSYVDLFTGKVGINEMSGIVGIGEVVSNTNGILEFLNLMGIISLAIGIANIMPFPPLDGGKVVIVLIERIINKKVPEKVEAIISYVGLGLLMLLTVYVTFNDILRII